MKNPNLETLTLQMSSADKEMLKADAKALGMVPSRYVVMLARCVNESAREAATIEFATALTSTVLKEVSRK